MDIIKLDASQKFLIQFLSSLCVIHYNSIKIQFSTQKQLKFLLCFSAQYFHLSNSQYQVPVYKSQIQLYLG